MASTFIDFRNANPGFFTPVSDSAKSEEEKAASRTATSGPSGISSVYYENGGANETVFTSFTFSPDQADMETLQRTEGYMSILKEANSKTPFENVAGKLTHAEASRQIGQYKSQANYLHALYDVLSSANPNMRGILTRMIDQLENKSREGQRMLDNAERERRNAKLVEEAGLNAGSTFGEMDIRLAGRQTKPQFGPLNPQINPFAVSL